MKDKVQIFDNGQSAEHNLLNQGRLNLNGN
jgi:hypothetical protein